MLLKTRVVAAQGQICIHVDLGLRTGEQFETAEFVRKSSMLTINKYQELGDGSWKLLFFPRVNISRQSDGASK